MRHDANDRWPATLGITCLSSTLVFQVAVLLLVKTAPVGLRFAVSALAWVSFALLFLPRVRATALTGRRVVIVAAALCGAAVAVAPLGHDIWSYAMYGRIVSAHRASPFTNVPADFPHDPLLHMVGWKTTPSVYGPGFVGVAALGTRITATSLLATRVFFQGLEAAALAAALVILWKRTRDPAALAFVGLSPAMTATIHEGHNDVLVALAVLAGALLVSKRRVVEGGAALAAGALVKIVALLPVAALVVWAWTRWGRAKALVLAATAGGIVAVAYAVAGGADALHPVLHAARARMSRSSIWQLSGLGVRTAGTVALATTLGLVTIVLVLSVRGASAEWVAGAVLLGFVLGAQYVLPWYAVWVLPVVALSWRSGLAALAMVEAALLQLAYAGAATASGWFHTYYGTLVPLCSLAGMATLLVLSRPRRPALPAHDADAAWSTRGAPV